MVTVSPCGFNLCFLMIIEYHLMYLNAIGISFSNRVICLLIELLECFIYFIYCTYFANILLYMFCKYFPSSLWCSVIFMTGIEILPWVFYSQYTPFLTWISLLTASLDIACCWTLCIPPLLLRPNPLLVLAQWILFWLCVQTPWCPMFICKKRGHAWLGA